jgi:hypothetical protein
MALLLRAFNVFFQLLVNDFVIGAEHRRELCLSWRIACIESPLAAEEQVHIRITQG